MGRAIYTVDTTAAVSLTSTVAKTTLAVLSPAQFGVDLLGFWVAFNGVSATDVPVFWELCTLSAATNSTPGTANTNESSTITLEGGRSITTGFTAFSASTSEPTVLAAIKSSYLTPNGGYYEYEWPFGDSPDNAVSTGFALRLTAPAAQTARAGFRFARC